MEQGLLVEAQGKTRQVRLKFVTASSFLIVDILRGTERRPKRDFAIQIRAYDATIHNYIQIGPE